MRCVPTPALHPARASQILSSAPTAVQKAVNVMMAFCSMDKCVLKTLTVAAMTMEKLIRYKFHVSVQKKLFHTQ